MPPYPGAGGVSAPTLRLSEQNEATERARSVIPGAEPGALWVLEALSRSTSCGTLAPSLWKETENHCKDKSTFFSQEIYSGSFLEVGFQSNVSS
ncbi:unnamed protein product [Boreogadus saida]